MVGWALWLAGMPATAGEPPVLQMGGGIAAGDMLGPRQFVTGGSPALLYTREAGPGAIRLHTGLYAAPFFLWLAREDSGIALLLMDLGVSVGNEQFRLGAFGTAGLIAAGAGVRAVVSPFEGGKGQRHGFEARATWMVPRTGIVSVAYVHTLPGPRPGPDVEPRGPGFCRRFGMGFGIASAWSSTVRAWEFVGQDVTVVGDLSPMLSVSCETAGSAGGWLIGGETAPWLAYRVPTRDGGSDRPITHFGSLTLGGFVGGDHVRVGPIVTAGVWTLGGGVRAVLSAGSEGGRHHGVELRALAMVPSAPSVEGMVLYHTWFDRKNR